VLEAMLNAEGPPDLSDDGKLMVYVSDSQSWQMTGGFGLAYVAGFPLLRRWLQRINNR